MWFQSCRDFVSECKNKYIRRWTCFVLFIYEVIMRNEEDISLTSQITELLWKGTSTIQDPGSSFQRPNVHIDLMVLAQRVDNGIVPKSPQLLMFYYQPLVCGTADFPVDVSLFFHTVDRILHCSQTLCHIYGRTDIVLRVINNCKLFILQSP